MLAILFCLFVFACEEISSAPEIPNHDVNILPAYFIKGNERTSTCPPGQVWIANKCRFTNQKGLSTCPPGQVRIANGCRLINQKSLIHNRLRFEN